MHKYHPVSVEVTPIIGRNGVVIKKSLTAGISVDRFVTITGLDDTSLIGAIGGAAGTDVLGDSIRLPSVGAFQSDLFHN